MGHLAGKDIYNSLGDKIDNLTVRVNKNKTLYSILRELYSPEEAELIVKMPYSLSSSATIAKVTGLDINKTRSLLESLSEKGLVMDLFIRDTFYYMPSPMFIGIFEFTMMRTDGNLDFKKLAKLFNEYLNDERSIALNFGDRQRVSPLRTMPHEGTILDEYFTEILSHENISSIIEANQKFSVGICSCRHEKLHTGEKKCDIPLETCISFGNGADFMVRHKFSKPATRSQVLESIARSRESGLVFSCDNVRKNVSFLCQCCGCCCNVLLGLRKYGYPNAVVTSNYIASVNTGTCEGCGKCAKACPINAIEMVNSGEKGIPGRKEVRINTEICIGCGVCSLKCSKTRSLKLIKRKKKVILPETTFERVILQCLERGTLQNQIFGNPERLSQKMMKGIIGGFLRLTPVKRALMSEKLRSSFLESMKKGASSRNREFVLKT